MKSIPRWLNCDRYLALAPAQRLNLLQAYLGENNGADRGVPNGLPEFVIQDLWNKFTETERHLQMVDLKAYAAVEVVMSARAQFDRAEAIKTCQHVWSERVPGVFTVACVKCGMVKGVA